MKGMHLRAAEILQREADSMKETRSAALVRTLSWALLFALLLSVCGSILCADHVCDDPCCVICRFAEMRRQLAWAMLSTVAAAFGLSFLCLTGVRRSAPCQRSFTLVSFGVQMND